MFTPLPTPKFWDDSIDTSPKEHRPLFFVGKGFFLVDNVDNRENSEEGWAEIYRGIDREYFWGAVPGQKFRSGRYRYNPRLTST